MKLKKILAVALAATTALSSGVAYEMLGAGTSKAAASLATTDTTFETTVDGVGTYKTSETAGVTTGPVTFTWQFTTVKSSNESQVASGKTANKVKLIKVAAAKSSMASGEYLSKVVVPANVDLTGQNVTLYDGTSSTTPITDAMTISGVELDASNISDGDKISKIDLATNDLLKTTSGATLVNVTLKNFDEAGLTTKIDFSTGVTSGSGVGLETINFNGSYVSYDSNDSNNELRFYIDSAKNGNTLKTLDIGDLANQNVGAWTNGGTTTTLSKATNPLDLSGITSIEKVDISGNSYITDLTVAPTVRGKAAARTIDISDVENLRTLSVNGDGAVAAKYEHVNGGMYPGIKFITDGSTASFDLDLSAYSMNDVKIHYANLESFKAPSEFTPSGSSSTGTVDVDLDHNYIKDIDLSNCRGTLKTLDVSYNKLLDIDLSSQDGISGTMDVSYNYLTSLDISGCDSDLGTVKADGNYIPKDNFTKGDLTGKSISNQQAASVDGFTILGDGGMADADSDAKAFVKLGGTANVVFAMAVVGAPEGFAERLASTITWTEANTSGGAIETLGESTILTQVEKYNGDILSYQDAIVVAVPVTVSAGKMAAEKLTINYGGESDSINIASDDIAIVSYDVTSNLVSENVQSKYANEILTAMFDFPQTAGVLSNGSAKVKTVSKSPEGKENSYTDGGIGQKYYNIALKTAVAAVARGGITVGTANMGYKWSNFNTVADGTGDAYKTAKTITVTEDMTLYATYTDKTYNVNFDKNGGTGTTDKMSNVNFGDQTTLSTNGFSYTDYNFVAWTMGYNATNLKANVATGEKQRTYADGEAVFGLKPSGSVSMYALWSHNDKFVNLKDSSFSLVLGDNMQNTADLGDVLDPNTTDGDGKTYEYANYNGQDNPSSAWSTITGTKQLNKNTKPEYAYFSSNPDVVEVNAINVAKAKGEGSATIYVVDLTNASVSSASVSVSTVAQDQAKKQELATQKSIDAGKATDVSDYSTYAAKVKKNADGEDTVTIVEGKDKKTVKISTITIGDKTYTVTRIGANAYKGSKKLTTLATGNNVKVIGKAAFASCKKLSKVTLGKAVAKIGANAFKNDTKLKTVAINNKKLTTAKKVNKTAFKNAGKSVKTKVTVKKSIVSKKVFAKEKKIFKKAGLKTYGKKTTTYKRK